MGSLGVSGHTHPRRSEKDWATSEGFLESLVLGWLEGQDGGNSACRDLRPGRAGADSQEAFAKSLAREETREEMVGSWRSQHVEFRGWGFI